METVRRGKREIMVEGRQPMGLELSGGERVKESERNRGREGRGGKKREEMEWGQHQ